MNYKLYRDEEDRLTSSSNRINPNRRRGQPPPEMQREILSMKLGFICPNVPGHLNPMTALARQLQSRRHDVLSTIYG
jgi:hypothetical protein